MGFKLKLVISSQVTAETRQGVMASAFARWPFCRGPRDTVAYLDRVVFAPPELTGYLYDSTDEYERVLNQVDEVETGLLEWSQAFPDITFAFIGADCFGGRCVYDGFCCREGKTLPSPGGTNRGRLTELLSGVVIETSGPFDPFVRGFFVGPGSGGFA